MGLLTFDLQAHRGGAGLAPENSLRAFARSMDLGVTTLETDVHVSQDGQPMLIHDRTLPDGEFVSWLPRARLPLPTLEDLITLVDDRGADVRLNIETKFDVVHPDEVAPRERFAEVVCGTLQQHGFAARASVQSFDWLVLDLVRAADTQIGLNVLTNTAYLEIGLPGASPWMAGVDVDDFDGNVVAAARGRGYDALSPMHTLITAEMVDETHAAGLRMIPYTVDEPAVMRDLVQLGVDGLITNRPDVLREVLAGLGLPLPRPWPAPEGSTDSLSVDES